SEGGVAKAHAEAPSGYVASCDEVDVEADLALQVVPREPERAGHLLDVDPLSVDLCLQKIPSQAKGPSHRTAYAFDDKAVDVEVTRLGDEAGDLAVHRDLVCLHADLEIVECHFAREGNSPTGPQRARVAGVCIDRESGLRPPSG